MKKQQTFLQENKSEQPPVDRFSNGAGKDAKTKPKDPKKPPKPSKGIEKNPETQCQRDDVQPENLNVSSSPK